MYEAKSGYYWESHPLVRSGYEDWLQIAYLLRKPGEDRCKAFDIDQLKHDARVYDSFRALTGQDATDQWFGKLPTNVSPFIGLPRSKTNPMSFASLADDVGLRKLHNFVYTYLSERSHPTGRNEEIFDKSKPIEVARIPKRDRIEESRLAFWFIWFTARVIVLAAKEFDINHEPFCDEYLLKVANNLGINRETCVYVKEYSKQKPPPV